MEVSDEEIRTLANHDVENINYELKEESDSVGSSDSVDLNDIEPASPISVNSENDEENQMFNVELINEEFVLGTSVLSNEPTSEPAPESEVAPAVVPEVAPAPAVAPEVAPAPESEVAPAVAPEMAPDEDCIEYPEIYNDESKPQEFVVENTMHVNPTIPKLI